MGLYFSLHSKLKVFLDNVKKNRQKSAARWKSHVLNPNLLHIATEQCNKLKNGIKLLKSLLYEVYYWSKNLKILRFYIDLEKSPSLRCKGVCYLCMISSEILSNRTI